MNNKKSLLIILAAIVVLIGGAYFLYEKLGEQVERPGLVVQEGAGSLEGTGNSQAGAADSENESGTTGSATGSEDTTQAGADSAGASGANTSESNTGNASGSNTAPDSNTAIDDTSDTTLTLAPDFTVYDADGNAFKLSDFRGKPVILNFWASWCGPCKSEMPDFEEVYGEYGEEIHFLMVNLTDGYQETVESATEFIADAGYTFPVYYDTASEAAYTYGVYSIPTTYFIDAEGYGVAYGSGAMNKDIIMTGIGMIYSEN